MNPLKVTQHMSGSVNTMDSTAERFCIYILGAGFSRQAGLPLANELWPEIRSRAKVANDRASQHFEKDLQAYIDYKRECDGEILSQEDVQFEEFIAYLDVEHYLGLRGSDTWSPDGNETQILVKTLIGEILTERTPQKENIPELYLAFARLLKPSDVVLTFNYDILLERALDVVGVAYRLFPSRYQNIGNGQAEVDNSREEVVVLKMHGSVDWFDRTQYDEVEEGRLIRGLHPGHEHPVFSKIQELGVKPLTDGPRFSGDPLQRICRVTNAAELYGSGPLFLATPLLLNPSPLKLVYSSIFQDFWKGLGRDGGLNFGMTIIGFSMPVQDEYLRQVIYRLVTNYQTKYWDGGFLKHRKTPLVMIDFRTDEKSRRELLDRYRFIDLNKAVTYWEGLNEGALATLEAYS
jgi:hypothetical protein